MKLELELTVEANDGNPSQLEDNVREALGFLRYTLTNHGSNKHICRVYKEMQETGCSDRTIEDSGSCWVAKAVVSV